MTHQYLQNPYVFFKVKAEVMSPPFQIKLAILILCCYSFALLELLEEANV